MPIVEAFVYEPGADLLVLYMLVEELVGLAKALSATGLGCISMCRCRISSSGGGEGGRPIRAARVGSQKCLIKSSIIIHFVGYAGEERLLPQAEPGMPFTIVWCTNGELASVVVRIECVNSSGRWYEPPNLICRVSRWGLCALRPLTCVDCISSIGALRIGRRGGELSRKCPPPHSRIPSNSEHRKDEGKVEFTGQVN